MQLKRFRLLDVLLGFVCEQESKFTFACLLNPPTPYISPLDDQK